MKSNWATGLLLWPRRRGRLWLGARYGHAAAFTPRSRPAPATSLALGPRSLCAGRFGAPTGYGAEGTRWRPASLALLTLMVPTFAQAFHRSPARSWCREPSARSAAVSNKGQIPSTTRSDLVC